MLKTCKQIIFPGIFCLLFSLSLSTAFADDLSDAKNAYGAGQFEEAATLLRPLVRQENVEALYLLARMYEQGDGVEKDLEEAKRLFRLAAEKGNEAAQQRLDIFDAQGDDDSVVIEWYLPSAEEGDTEAQYNLGFMYETGWGVQVNEKEAIRWYREAAEMQHDIAQLRLGMMLIVGVDGKQSIDEGLALLRRSAENGNRVAEALVQDLFDAGDVSTDDAVRIVAGIRRVLDEGEKHTLDTLRRSLELLYKKTEPQSRVASSTSLRSNIAPKHVDVVEAVTGKKNTVRSNKKSISNSRSSSLHDQKKEEKSKKGNLFNWYLKRANQGEADSQYHIGVMFIKGEQVGRDVEEGVRWIKLAAEQGHKVAATYMELWNGDLSVNSFESSIAVRWLKEMGRTFDINAIFDLGFLYEMGRGVQKNFQTAKKWYEFAAIEGHAEAKRRLALLKRNHSQPENITSSSGTATMMSFPVMISLLLGLLACLGGYYLYQRRKAGVVSLPSMDTGGGQDVIKQVENPQGLQTDDKKFFDELWEPSKSPAVKASDNKSVTNSSVEREKTVDRSVADVKKSSDLSEVEKKLAKAIDELMVIGEAEKMDDNNMDRKNSATFTESKVIATDGEVEKKNLKTNLEETIQELEKISHSNAVVKESSPEKNKHDVSLEAQSSREVTADTLLHNGISMNELAVSRVSADNLFADGVAIDEAGKAVGRGTYDPKKIDAGEMLKIHDLSSKSSISIKSISTIPVKTRPIGPAASLLPKQNDDAKLEKDITTDSIDEITMPSLEEVDVTAPLNDTEERSLAEVHFNIGVMFSKGDGVPKNATQAAKWFLKAAEEGMPEAQFSIGQCYLSGNGVQQNTSLAMKWIQKAARNNFKPAQEEIQKRNRAS